MVGSVVLRTDVHDEAVAVIELGMQTRPLANRWRFEVFSSAWRLQSVDAVIAGAGDSVEFTRPSLARLSGATLSRVTVAPAFFDARLWFGDLEFRVFPEYTGDDPGYCYWSVSLPTGRELIVGPGRRFRFATTGDR